MFDPLTCPPFPIPSPSLVVMSPWGVGQPFSVLSGPCCALPALTHAPWPSLVLPHPLSCSPSVIRAPSHCSCTTGSSAAASLMADVTASCMHALPPCCWCICALLALTCAPPLVVPPHPSFVLPLYVVRFTPLTLSLCSFTLDWPCVPLVYAHLSLFAAVLLPFLLHIRMPLHCLCKFACVCTH